MDFETVRYETDGQIATITLNRPEAANAQNTQMIEDIDASFDSAEADDEVRVVILAAEGKHFSSGHDLKEILRGEEHWAAMRATPEGKLQHEQVMYWDKLIRIRDFPKITIAAVQGTCAAAGLMLACMCDLIVAADDAQFSNPVLRMGGRRRRAAGRAVGARRAQGQGVPVLRGDARRGRSRARRAREPGRPPRRPARRPRARWPVAPRRSRRSRPRR